MSRGDVDLVAAVRQELASLIPERRCCRRAELDALADSGRRADIAVARTIHRLAANSDDAVRRRGASRGANPPGSAARSAAAVERAARRTGASHCRRAVLRGRFLARGSLSFASGRVHLELVVPPAEGDAIERMLTRESLGGARRERRGRALFVWKSAAGVLRLLRVLGGGPSVAAFEDLTPYCAAKGGSDRCGLAARSNRRRSTRGPVRLACGDRPRAGHVAQFRPAPARGHGARSGAPGRDDRASSSVMMGA